MRRSKPELIVPIRDRRQHRRILTLKNFRNACFVLVALYAGSMIAAHFRNAKPHDDLGRLVAGRITSSTSLPKQPSVAQTEVIDDQTAADPTLVQAMNRSQILLDQPATSTAQVAAPATTADAPLLRQNAANVAIVGGPEGVTLVQRDAKRPVLGGGFGR